MFVNKFKLDNIDKIYKNCYLYDIIYRSLDGKEHKSLLIPIAKEDLRDMSIVIESINETDKEIIDIIAEDQWKFKTSYDFIKDKYPKVIEYLDNDFELWDFDLRLMDKHGDLENVKIYFDSDMMEVIGEFLSSREEIYAEIFGEDDEEEI
jgi:hypothetical protein